MGLSRSCVIVQNRSRPSGSPVLVRPKKKVCDRLFLSFVLSYIFTYKNTFFIYVLYEDVLMSRLMIVSDGGAFPDSPLVPRTKYTPQIRGCIIYVSFISNSLTYLLFHLCNYLLLHK